MQQHSTNIQSPTAEQITRRIKAAKTYYDVLNLTNSSKLDSINREYQHIRSTLDAKVVCDSDSFRITGYRHPDSAVNYVRIVIDAYIVLKNDRLREQYDKKVLAIQNKKYQQQGLIDFFSFNAEQEAKARMHLEGWLHANATSKNRSAFFSKLPAEIKANEEVLKQYRALRHDNRPGGETVKEFMAGWFVAYLLVAEGQSWQSYDEQVKWRAASIIAVKMMEPLRALEDKAKTLKKLLEKLQGKVSVPGGRFFLEECERILAWIDGERKEATPWYRLLMSTYYQQCKQSLGLEDFKALKAISDLLGDAHMKEMREMGVKAMSRLKSDTRQQVEANNGLAMSTLNGGEWKPVESSAEFAAYKLKLAQIMPATHKALCEEYAITKLDLFVIRKTKQPAHAAQQPPAPRGYQLTDPGPVPRQPAAPRTQPPPSQLVRDSRVDAPGPVSGQTLRGDQGLMNSTVDKNKEDEAIKEVNDWLARRRREAQKAALRNTQDGRSSAALEDHSAVESVLPLYKAMCDDQIILQEWREDIKDGYCLRYFVDVEIPELADLHAQRLHDDDDQTMKVFEEQVRWRAAKLMAVDVLGGLRALSVKAEKLLEHVKSLQKTYLEVPGDEFFLGECHRVLFMTKKEIEYEAPMYRRHIITHYQQAIAMSASSEGVYQTILAVLGEIEDRIKAENAAIAVDNAEIDVENAEIRKENSRKIKVMTPSTMLQQCTPHLKSRADKCELFRTPAAFEGYKAKLEPVVHKALCEEFELMKLNLISHEPQVKQQQQPQQPAPSVRVALNDPDPSVKQPANWKTQPHPPQGRHTQVMPSGAESKTTRFPGVNLSNPGVVVQHPVNPKTQLPPSQIAHHYQGMPAVSQGGMSPPEPRRPAAGTQLFRPTGLAAVSPTQPSRGTRADAHAHHLPPQPAHNSGVRQHGYEQMQRPQAAPRLPDHPSLRHPQPAAPTQRPLPIPPLAQSSYHLQPAPSPQRPVSSPQHPVLTPQGRTAPRGARPLPPPPGGTNWRSLGR